MAASSGRIKKQIMTVLERSGGSVTNPHGGNVVRTLMSKSRGGSIGNCKQWTDALESMGDVEVIYKGNVPVSVAIAA